MSVCSICLEDIDRVSPITTLECKHKFHTHCIFKALRYDNTCPYCRSLILKEKEDSEPTTMDELYLQTLKKIIHSNRMSDFEEFIYHPLVAFPRYRIVDYLFNLYDNSNNKYFKLMLIIPTISSLVMVAMINRCRQHAD